MKLANPEKRGLARDLLKETNITKCMSGNKIFITEAFFKRTIVYIFSYITFMNL